MDRGERFMGMTGGAALTEHERNILESDAALCKAARLVKDRIPLDLWPQDIQGPMWMALSRAGDDPSVSANRVSAYRARDMLRFLKRRGIVASDADAEKAAAANAAGSANRSLYVMDRLLADLVPMVIRVNHALRSDR